MPILQPPKKDADRRAWIKYQLELRGHSFASLAREYSIDRSCVRQALDKPYPKMERIIADKLGITPEAIWPERHLPGKQAKRKRRAKQ